MKQTAPEVLRSFVNRIENLETEIKERNSDKSDVYAEAKSTGFDVKALKIVIARRRKDPSELQEHDAMVDLYLQQLDKPIPSRHARPRTHEAQPVAPVVAREPSNGSEVDLEIIAAIEAKLLSPEPTRLPAAPPEYDPADIPAAFDRRITP